MSDYVISSTPKKVLLRGFGAILEDATPDERDLMMASLPAVPRFLYSVWGKGAYIKDATAVRGVAPTGL
jgi:hypothetical protein